MRSTTLSSYSSGAMPYRIAAIDLDDTLLGPDKHICPANTQAVDTLRTLGVHVVLASGRRHENMIRFHRQLGLEGYIVSSQGALVRHAETDHLLHRRVLPAKMVQELVCEGKRHGASVVVYHEAGCFVDRRDAATDLYEKRNDNRVAAVGDLSRLPDNAVLKVLWVADPDRAARLYAEASEKYRGLAEVVPTEPEYVEFLANGLSKAEGLAALAACHEVSPSQVLAFGDGDNDVQMLKWAGCGVAMPHARPSALAAADFVAPDGDPETAFARAVYAVVDSQAKTHLTHK